MKRTYIIIVIIIIIIGVTSLIVESMTKVSPHQAPTITSTARFVRSTITADGFVTAQDQATLNFQTGGKLIYLPFKQGDHISAGLTIAQLDTYELQHELTAALNTYRSTRDTFDQGQQNTQNNQLQASLQSSYSSVKMDKSNAINDAVKRIVDQNQSSLDNSVINVELANYALQLARLTAPINGIITRQDATVPGLNITPTTTFIIADPDSMVFRANIPISYIYYISEGSSVAVAIDGMQQRFKGTVAKIYPTKVTLSSGEVVYQVDIAITDLKKFAKFDLTGTAIISTNAKNVALVPVWTVLGGKYIWISENGTPKLKEIKVGKIHGNEIEVTAGLEPQDKIIIDPSIISQKNYSIL